MEIREAAQRIFRVRGIVILACFVAGLAAGFSVHKVLEKTTYTASARLVLGGSVPRPLIGRPPSPARFRGS